MERVQLLGSQGHMENCFSKLIFRLKKIQNFYSVIIKNKFYETRFLQKINFAKLFFY